MLISCKSYNIDICKNINILSLFLSIANFLTKSAETMLSAYTTQSFSF